MMETNKIIEGNKLIAEFMGAKWSKTAGWDFDMFASPYSNCYNNLKFHLSWDWLMPVVEKIEIINEDLNFVITSLSVGITINKDFIVPPKNSMHGGYSKLKSVWQAVIEFIKWYNQQ